MTHEKRNQCLAGHSGRCPLPGIQSAYAECAISLVSSPGGEPEVIRAYPQGAEREAINAVFDEIVADLKLEHIFTHSEQPLSLAESKRPSVLGQLAAGKQQQKPAPAVAKAKSEPEI